MPDLLKRISEFGSTAYQANKNLDRLSIQLRLNGFSLCISNPTEGRIFYFAEYKIIERTSHKNDWQDLANAFEDWILHNKSISENFLEYKIVIDSDKYSILPTSFVSENTLTDQLDFCQNIAFKYFPNKDNILDSQEELVYPIHIGLHSVIQENFAEAIIVHTSSELHRSVMNSKLNIKEENFVVSYVSDRDLHIQVFKNGSLKFQNCYKYTSKEDFIYFIILTYNTQNLNPESDTLFLIGDINPSSALYNICYQYIRNIELLNQVHNLVLENSFDSLAIHQYFIQLNSAL